MSTHMKRHHLVLLLGSPARNKQKADMLFCISQYTGILNWYRPKNTGTCTSMFFVSVHSSTQQGHICLSSLEIACSVVSSLGFFMHQKTVGDKWICFEEDTVLVGARPSCSSCANMNAILNVRTLSPNLST